MVFARTSKSASRLSEQIRQNNMKKTYLAVFEEEIKQKRRAEKIQNLILSMDEEYRLTCPKNACKIRRSERTIKRTVYPSFLLLCF